MQQPQKKIHNNFSLNIFVFTVEQKKNTYGTMHEMYFDADKNSSTVESIISRNVDFCFQCKIVSFRLNNFEMAHFTSLRNSTMKQNKFEKKKITKTVWFGFRCKQ